MDQLVADDEDRLGLAGQHHRHQRTFPDGQVADDENLPERECEGQRPEKHP